MTIATLRDLDIRHLTALVAVAEEGTFAKAATALGFTQSAISQQIARLERSAGLALLDRPKGPRRAELTAAGEHVLQYARTVLSGVDEMDQDLDRMRRGISGRLIVGTFQSVSAQLLPTVLGRMRTEVPEVEIELFETEDVAVIKRMVATNELDLAFVVNAEPEVGFVAECLGLDPFVVMVPTGAIGHPSVSPDQLNQHPLIGQPGNNVCQAMVEQRLTSIGVAPSFAYRFQDNGAVQGMVRSGMGWAVVPLLTIDTGDPGIDVVELDPPVQPRSIGIVRRQHRTLAPVADHFVAVARDVSASVLQPMDDDALDPVHRS